MSALAPIGRFLFALMFILSGYRHLQNTEALAGYAASQGIPMPEMAVIASGIMLLVGGVLVLVGAFARFGALLVAIFLLVAAFTMHRFWAIEDPMAAQMQFSHFMKNLSMAGGAFLLMYFGPGPFSIHWARRRRATSGDEVSVPLRERFGEP